MFARRIPFHVLALPLALLAGLLTLLLVSVSPAAAAEPWWQLSSSSVPARLSSGSGRDAVQEIKVSATAGNVVVIEPVSFEEYLAKKIGIGELRKAEFAYDATPAAAQTALEGLYGAGNVEVVSGASGAASYVVSFKGALADQTLKLMKTEYSSLFGKLAGTATTTQTVEGKSDGEIVVTATNLGDLPVIGSATPVTITDVLPAGVEAAGVGTARAGTNGHGGTLACSPSPPASSFPASSVTCTWSEPKPLEPFEVLEVPIEVNLDAGVQTGAENEVKISGGEGYLCKKQEGGAFTSSFCAGTNGPVKEPSGYEAELTGQVVAPVSLTRPLTIGGGATPFGVEDYTLTPESEGGTPDTQAGSHPFQLTTTIALNQTANPEKPPAFVKDLHFQWPAGLIGNPTALPQCTESEFSATLLAASNLCPADTAVGVASVTFYLPYLASYPITDEVPVFNLVPARGEPARFGFEVETAAVTIDPSVRTGRDYGITVSVDNISQLVNFISSRVTVWGVPGAAAHDGTRGWSCLRGGDYVNESAGALSACGSAGEAASTGAAPPFLALPTSCSGSPLVTTLEADSWKEPGDLLSVGSSEAMPTLDGCGRLPFDASLEVAPDVQSASSPTGLTVKVHVPQEVSLDAEGLAAADVKDTTVTLPEGVSINPAGANGLEACSEALIGFEGVEEPSATDLFTSRIGSPFCPDASKIGTAKIDVPILAHPLEGAVYLAAQTENPFGSLVAMYIVAEDPVSGVLVKLAGEVTLNPVTGQLTSTFLNTPQAPFEELELSFFGGERAPLATPAHCGSYTTNASFTPWSGNAPVDTSTEFKITSGPDGSACPGASLPFAPSFAGGPINNQAGAFSALSTTLGREDGNQDLQSVQLKMPAGLSGILAGVKLCGEAQANAGTCGPESEIGETTVSVGLGGDPYTVKGGKVFITEKYEGAPFGLSIVNPAVAGPYNLGQVVVRAKIEVNPLTAALTITTDSSGAYKIPTILDGIPLEIKHINVTISRPGFTFNPTSCEPMSITGSLASSEGSSSAIAVPLQVTNCAALKFKPAFTASTSGKTSRRNGASLHVQIVYPKEAFGSEANIHEVKVELPKALPSRLSTLQKACLAATFEADPAACPAESVVGQAKAITPLLPVPLEGPAYFVSYGGAKFPELVMVLQGYGVTIDLHGETFISKKGVTSSTFKTVPDQPVESFELTLPQGSDSALAANEVLCKKTLLMPTLFVAQNGTQVKQQTKIAVQGCAKKLLLDSHKVKGRTLTLKITVPAAGKLSASGKGLTTVSKKPKGRETLTIKLKETKSGKLKSHVKLAFKPSGKAKKLTKTLAVSFGKARQKAKR